MLADRLDVSLLLDRAGGALPQPRERAVHTGRVTALSGWLGAFNVSWEQGNPIDPRPVHALQRLHRRLPGRRDRLQLPDRPRHAARPPRLRRRLRRRRRDRLRARAADHGRDLRPRARPARAAGVRAPPVAAGLLPRRRRRRAQAVRRGAEAARVRRRVREAEVLQLQAEALCAQPQREGRLQRLHRGLLGAGDLERGDDAPAASRSSRTCASAAAPAPRCARAARWASLLRTRRPGPAPAHAALDLPQRRRADAALLLHSEGAGAALSSSSAARRARAGDIAACRRA